MSKFEDIVPPLELCKLIPDGEFEDSALVWFMWEQADGKLTGNVVPREMKDQFASVLPALLAVLKRDVPSPTLAEIMDAIPVCNMQHEEDWLIGARENGHTYSGKDDTNPANAALRLWLKLKGIEVK